MGKLFGTDGVRGLANEELTPELAFKLGKAGAQALTKQSRHTPRIIVGKDTRRSCYMLESALCAGMCSVGAEVLLAGVLPTPAVAYLTRKYGLDAGVVISASHNPFYDNGIKFFNSKGYKLDDDTERDIEELIKDIEALPRPTGKDVGVCRQCPEALTDYVDFLVESAPGLSLEGMKLALDCANGAAYMAAPMLFERLGADVHVLNNAPDGLNINSDCGSTHMEGLCAYVRENGLQAGIAFDGDGDRCLMTDEGGNMVDGDQIMSICGMHMKEKGLLAQDTIVATVMSNLGFMIMGEKQGINIQQTAVGDRYVLERMLQGGFSLGGEQSGHIIFLAHNTTGDGLLTSLTVAAIIKEQGRPLSEINSYMEVLPQALTGARVGNAKKQSYMENPIIRQEISRIEDQLKGEGRVLIRPSGTEPLIRIMLEGRDKAFLDAEASRLAALFEECLKD